MDQQTPVPAVPMDASALDSSTIERFRLLADVGRVLSKRSDDKKYETDYFLAKESLKQFKMTVDRMPLEPVSMQGIQDLIHYLDAKIDKRLSSYVNMTTY